MRLKTAFLLIVFTVLSSFHVKAQEPERWTWEQCIQYALDNNLQLKQSALNTSLTGLQLKQNQLSITPSINGSFNNSYSFGRTLDPTTYSFIVGEISITNRFQLSLQQPVFEGLKNLYSIRKSKSELVALTLDDQALKEDIQLNILTSYLNILNADEQVKQALEQEDRTVQQIANTIILIEGGALAEATRNDIDAQLTGDDLYISQMRNQRALAYQVLMSILQLEPGKEIEIETIPADAANIASYPMPTVMEVYQAALGNQPRIKSADQRIKSSQLAIKAAKGNYYPSISLFSTVYTNHSNKYLSRDGTFNIIPIGALQSDPTELVVTAYPNFVKSNFFEQLGDNMSYSFGVSLNIPIYNKRMVWLGVKQSQLNLEAATLERKQRELNLYNDIRQAWLKAQAAIENYAASEKAYDAAERSRKFAEDRFEAGSINLLQLNLANSNVASAQSRLTQAKYEFLFNTRVLDYYMGKPIQF